MAPPSIKIHIVLANTYTHSRKLQFSVYDTTSINMYVVFAVQETKEKQMKEFYSTGQYLRVRVKLSQGTKIKTGFNVWN